jgi:membrane-bound serine protease (ClpP class)
VLRGRDAEWVADAVKKSSSLTSSEAVKKKVVEYQAADLNELLQQIHDREVDLPQGKVRLRTAGAEVRTLEMGWGYHLLNIFANPNVAFLLMTFGVIGIMYELFTPGWGVGGTIGVICLLLGFFSLAVLPVSYVGLALILIGLGMFVAEVFVTSYGFLTVGGIICLSLGGLMLIDSPFGFPTVSAWVVVPLALAMGAITFFLLTNVVRTHRRQALTGSEGMLRTQAVAEEKFTPSEDGYRGMVLTHGELWQAVSANPIHAGQAVQIEERKGLLLRVRPAVQEASSSPGDDAIMSPQPL